MRNYAFGGSAVVIAAAIGAAVVLPTDSPHQAGSGVDFDAVPGDSNSIATAPPSGASAAPGAGANPGAGPQARTSTAPPPPKPPAPSVVTKTVRGPAPPAPAAPAASAPRTSAEPRSPRPPTTASPTTTEAPATTTEPPGPAITTEPPAPGATTTAPAPSTTTTTVTTPPAGGSGYVSDATPNCAVAKCVALTFSGGPSPETRQFLSVLDRHGARGTFFVTGAQVAQNADVVAAITGSGNEIANGTWDQADLTTLGAAEQEQQLADTDQAVKVATGISPSLFRPMGGHSSPDVVAAGRREGLTQVLWDIDSQDYSHQGDPSAIAAAIERAKPGQIVMLHDTFPDSATGLDQALSALEAKGYAFVTASTLLGSRGAQ
ncbi:polysaccharide deacetylase family protein [Tsukamurella sp. 8J]|uniref:polysaccharide deacetylase family protein n=1 Tax=Tsukamurella sp. 8J TaxID=3031962 RepID=UPI0023B8E06A|nr:polysaccharide deacetylase family protein [Tsukamurella sp. 8J]MDF0530172.1 polysaccharide deacetylase family protein [Tsukamurella sp. 8J]